MSLETPQNNEKIRFNSPEHLAIELEQRSKIELANRIRQIAKQVENNSMDWREKLKKELRPDEEASIREALPNSEALDMFSEGVNNNEPSISSTQNSENENNNNQEKFEEIQNKFEGFGKRFNNAKEVYEKISEINKGGFFGTISGIMAAIAYFFTGKAPKLPEGTNFSFGKEGKGKENEGKNEESKENNGDMKYLGGIELLYLVKGDKSKEYTKTILLQKEIKEKSFNELKKYYDEGKKGISTKLGLNDRGNDDKIYESIELLIKNQDFINSTIGKVNPEWKNQDLGNTLIELNKKGALLNSINKKLSSIELSTNPLDSFNKLSNVNLLSIDINSENNEIGFGDLEDRKDMLKGLEKGNLIKILRGEKIKNNNDLEQRTRYYGLVNNSENEKQFIDKIYNYQPKIVNVMSNLFGNKGSNDFKEYFKNNGISPKDLIELYLITGDNPNFESMDGVTKSLIYLKTWKMLGDDKSFRGEHFDRKLLEAFNEKNIIPEDVKNILLNVFGKTGELFLKGAFGILGEIYEAIPTSQKTIIAGIIGIALYTSFRVSPLRAVTITAITGMIASAIVGTAIAHKYSDKQIEQAVKDYLKTNNIS